jgi:OPT family oligopeptide transporter
MNFLLTSDELGPVHLPTWKLVAWSLGLCYFGVVFAVPLRRQVIIRERLRFPSGFSTALLIGVLHGQDQGHRAEPGKEDPASSGGFASLVPGSGGESSPLLGSDPMEHAGDDAINDANDDEAKSPPRGTANMRLLLICFGVSAILTVLTYFFPMLRNLPVFGRWAAESWLWTLNPSLAYVGQGIIMGPETTAHMLLGAFVGWAILSPLAHHRGWAPGSIGDWETGSKGWIVWVSLAIMLADSVVSLAHVSVSSLLQLRLFGAKSKMYKLVGREELDPILEAEWEENENERGSIDDDDDDDDDDAPPDQQLGRPTVWAGLALSIIICIGTIHLVFGSIMPLYATMLSVGMALMLSVMGVRALGETDLNPVSGISKVAQLFFALVVPSSSKASVLVNLIGGAVAEAVSASGMLDACYALFFRS